LFPPAESPLRTGALRLVEHQDVRLDPALVDQPVRLACEGLWQLIGQTPDCFDPHECRNYFKHGLCNVIGNSSSAHAAGAFCKFLRAGLETREARTVDTERPSHRRSPKDGAPGNAAKK